MKRCCFICFLALPALCAAQQKDTTYWPSGRIQSAGNKVDGKKDSVWTFWYENGIVSARITYRNDQMNGKFWYYYSNTKLMQQGFAVDDVHGIDH